jgi:hypothetical protein
MAKYFKFYIPLISFICLLNACQEGGDAGDLFGQWRLDGSDSKYISFSGSITHLKDIEIGEIYGNFQHQGDSLFMQCYSQKGEKSDTIVVEQSFGFHPINNIRLKVVTLSDNRLVLTKGGQSWNFYKY